ncbi:MAG: hypothetical protein J6Y37_08825 [Paludibacteraceae bacterium]|nr:hypothetical protein [Paludibacteraceae bacterium]
MAKTNRRTLKEYFSQGKKPDSTQFADLIDSMFNIVDDGLVKTSDGGLVLSPTNGSRAGSIMEIRQDILDGEAAWRFSVDEKGAICIKRGETDDAVVALHQDGSVSVSSELRVDGNVSATSYCGNVQEVEANGQWQDISIYNYACSAYHIVAKAHGRKGAGLYAMCEVSAMNCFGKHRKVSYLCHSWFGSWFNKIQVRWNRKESDSGQDVYGLQIRTRSNFGEQAKISYYIQEK